MHKIQKIILKRLLNDKKQRYSVLTRGYNYENNIVFHLKQLIGKGLISKESNYYLPTASGIKQVMKYNMSLLEDIGFKSFLFGFLCECEGKYLIKSHPQASKDFYNLPSGQPRFGESTEDALVRSFYNNTGVKIKSSSFNFLSLHIKTIKTSSGEVLFDDAFAIYKTTVNKEQKEKMKLHKQISWMTLDEIKKLNNKWSEINIIIEKNTSPYKTYTFTSDYIL